MYFSKFIILEHPVHFSIMDASTCCHPSKLLIILLSFKFSTKIWLEISKSLLSLVFFANYVYCDKSDMASNYDNLLYSYLKNTFKSTYLDTEIRWLQTVTSQYKKAKIFNDCRLSGS